MTRRSLSRHNAARIETTGDNIWPPDPWWSSVWHLTLLGLRQPINLICHMTVHFHDVISTKNNLTRYSNIKAYNVMKWKRNENCGGRYILTCCRRSAFLYYLSEFGRSGRYYKSDSHPERWYWRNRSLMFHGDICSQISGRLYRAILLTRECPVFWKKGSVCALYLLQVIVRIVRFCILIKRVGTKPQTYIP